MEESSSETISSDLPKVLISAATSTDTESFKQDLVDNEIKRDDGVCEWRLENKYYTTSVQVITHADSTYAQSSEQNAQVDPTLVQAHLIYLSGLECLDIDTMVKTAAQRAANAVLGHADVKLLVCDTEDIPSSLETWARTAHYEAIPLKEKASTPDSDPGPFPELYGIERIRAALHAHIWPGVNLVRNIINIMDGNSSDSDWEGNFNSDTEEEQAVEHAELFSAALSALGDHRGRQTQEEDRLNRAEALVAAFCRALGHNIDTF